MNNKKFKKILDQLNQNKLERITLHNLSIYQILEFAVAIKNNTKLSSLIISGISDEGIKCIAETLKTNKAIVSLGLMGNQFGYKGIGYIFDTFKMNNKIVNLSLSGNNISDEAAKYIAKELKVNTSLLSLSLGKNKISCEGIQLIAEALKLNNRLTYLAIPDNKIDDTGTKYIANALKVNNSLVSLNLNDNQIGDAGAKDILDALQFNTSLTSLFLSNNKISHNIAKLLSKKFRNSDSELSILSNSGTFGFYVKKGGEIAVKSFLGILLTPIFLPVLTGATIADWSETKNNRKEEKKYLHSVYLNLGEERATQQQNDLILEDIHQFVQRNEKANQQTSTYFNLFDQLITDDDEQNKTTKDIPILPERVNQDNLFSLEKSLIVEQSNIPSTIFHNTTKQVQSTEGLKPKERKKIAY